MAVASGASNALVHVNAVVEVNEVGEIVNTPPFNGTAAGPTIANRLGKGRVRPDLRMARHACFGRGEAGKMRGLNAGMAVAAIDAVIFHVMLVAEWNWLFRRFANESDPVAPVHDVSHS